MEIKHSGDCNPGRSASSVETALNLVRKKQPDAQSLLIRVSDTKLSVDVSNILLSYMLSNATLGFYKRSCPCQCAACTCNPSIDVTANGRKNPGGVFPYTRHTGMCGANESDGF